MKYSELTDLSIIGKLNYLIKNYDNSYKAIAEYILYFDEEYKYLSLKKIANGVYVSTTTVERFVKVVGYSKFNDFKYNLIFELENNHSNKKVYNNENYFLDLHKSLDDTLQLINLDNLKKFANHLVESRVIIIIGLGSSFLIASDLSYKLERMGIISKAISDPNLIYFNTSLAQSSDLVIAITYSGKSKIINEGLRIANANGATTAILTSIDNQYKYSNIDYQMNVSAEDKLLRTNSSSARIVMLAYIDAIHTEILKSPKRQLFEKNIEKTKLKEY